MVRKHRDRFINIWLVIYMSKWSIRIIIVSQRLFTAWREEEMDNVCQCVRACVAVLSGMPDSYGWTDCKAVLPLSSCNGKVVISRKWKKWDTPFIVFRGPSKIALLLMGLEVKIHHAPSVFPPKWRHRWFCAYAVAKNSLDKKNFCSVCGFMKIVRCKTTVNTICMLITKIHHLLNLTFLPTL